MNVNQLPPWESMMKQIAWKQIGDVNNKRVLDFGSGYGVTACYLAKNNDVVAIEPSMECVEKRWTENKYQQICGSTEQLKSFPKGSFDVIICHNVLEYVPDKKEILKEFARLLAQDGFLSIVKHNRAGRVMQMVVLLNNFEHANSLLDGNNGQTSQFGEIKYYEDNDISKLCNELVVKKTMGLRTFWDLQQNQEIHKDLEWQQKMIEIEMRVSELKEYQEIAFFHHLIIQK